MHLRNHHDGYDLVAITLHWLIAVSVIGMFLFGLWMTSLTYYDAWYRTAPALHKSTGIVLFVVMVLRVAWRLYSPPPPPLPSHTALERKTAHGAHLLLYVLLFALMLSGYLISTADGRGIEVFGLFSIPATLTSIPHQEDVAGDVHLALALTVIGLAALHALAAFKHHFFDKDRTLLRMLGH